MYCTNCGKEVPNGTNVCPSCFAVINVTAKPKKKKQPTALIAVVCIVVFIIVGFAFFGNNENALQPVTQNTTNASTTKSSTIPTQNVLIDDKYVRVSYIDRKDVPGVDGMAMLQFKIENKTNKTVTAMIENLAVNKMAIQALPNATSPIAPGNASAEPFGIGLGNVGIKSANDINRVRFSIRIFDGNDFSYETKIVDFSFQ